MPVSNPAYWAWLFRRPKGVGVYAISTEAGLPELSDEEFIELVSETSAPRLLLFTSALSVLRTNRRDTPDYDERRDALELTEHICTEGTAERIRAFLRSGTSRVFIHDEQLLLLTKAAILYGKDDDAPLGAGVLEQLLLGANDLLGRDAALSGDDDSPITPDRELRMVLRQVGGFRHQQMRYLLGRYFDLLVVRARRRLADSSGLDLDAAFAQYLRAVAKMEHPVTVETYMGYVFLYYAMFARAITLADFMQIVQSNRSAEYEAQTTLTDVAELRRVFGRTRKELAEKFAGRASLASASYVPLRDRPMLLQADHSPIILSMPFLLDKVSTGVFYGLQQQYLQQGSGNDVGILVSYVGELFQSYLTELLGRMYSRMAGMQKRVAFHDEASVQAASPGKRTAMRPPFDGVIVEGGAVVTIEMTAISITLTTIESGDVERFKAEIRRDFRKKFRQIRDTVDGLANGAWVVPDIAASEIEDIYPVIALLVPFPQHPATWHVLYECGKEVWNDWPDRSDRTSEKSSPDNSHRFRVHAPQIITAEEWETLEPLLVYSKQYLTDLLRMKLSVWGYGEMEMKEYLDLVLHVPDIPNEHVWALTSSAINTGTAKIGFHDDDFPDP